MSAHKINLKPATRWTAMLALICTAIFAVDANATTYFVSTSGNDANSCATATSATQASQKLTISAGLTCLSSGDTLSIHGGTYVENITVPTTANGSSAGASGSSWPHATNITAYTGETVWLTPPGGVQAVLFATGGTPLSYQIWSGINIDGSNLGGAPSGEVYIGHDAHHIRWQNSEIKNSYWTGIAAFQGPYIEIKNNLIHDGDRRCSGDGGHGIYISGFDGSVAGADQHSLIEGNTIYNFGCQTLDAGIALFTGPSDTDSLGGFVVRKNWLRGNGVGTFLGEATTVPIQFYNNIVSGNRGSGVAVYSRIAGTLVYNNTIYGNGDRGIEVGTGGTATGILIKNNAIVSNAGAPITVWNADTTSGGTFQFNDFYGNGNSNAVADQNSLSTNSSNITTSPGFTNAAANDFTISAGGNLVNAGTTLATVTDDYVGVSRPQGGAYDIGAYEYPSTNSTPPVVSLSASSVSFGSTAVGASSSVQYVTVSNTGNVTLNLSNVVFSGDFAPAGLGTCGVSIPVAAGTSCTISIHFMPVASGLRTGSIVLTDNASPATQTINLSGTGTASAFSACDVNQDGATNIADVQTAVNQVLGTSACVPFGQPGSADINHDGTCTVLDIQRVINAALSGTCVSP